MKPCSRLIDYAFQIPKEFKGRIVWNHQLKVKTVWFHCLGNLEFWFTLTLLSSGIVFWFQWYTNNVGWPLGTAAKTTMINIAEKLTQFLNFYLKAPILSLNESTQNLQGFFQSLRFSDYGISTDHLKWFLSQNIFDCRHYKKNNAMSLLSSSIQWNIFQHFWFHNNILVSYTLYLLILSKSAWTRYLCGCGICALFWLINLETFEEIYLWNNR